jgi:hypothetical protein
MRPVLRRLAPLLGAALVAAGCASSPIDAARSFASVHPLPSVTALDEQKPSDQEWDVKDCQAEAGYRTNYSPTDSPLANIFQKLFFWGTAGAAVGGTIDGFPTIVDQSTASTGLIVGASTGGATGAALSIGGQSSYERAWAACMRAKGYAVHTRPAGGDARR